MRESGKEGWGFERGERGGGGVSVCGYGWTVLFGDY